MIMMTLRRMLLSVKQMDAAQIVVAIEMILIVLNLAVKMFSVTMMIQVLLMNALVKKGILEFVFTQRI